MVLDDHSTPEGAAQAAQAAIGAGAELIVGPLFSPSVREVGSVAKAAGSPVIAFSTDTSVAARGVYLLSFLIEGYVDRIMEYAHSKGKKSFAAMAPQSDYGNIAVAEFQQAASRLGVRVVTIARYAPGQAASAARQIAARRQSDRRAVHSRTGRRHGRRQRGAGRERRQDADPRHRHLERRARA